MSTGAGRARAAGAERQALVLAVIVCGAVGGCHSTVDSLGYNDGAGLILHCMKGPASYPNVFGGVLGKSDVQISQKIEDAFNQLFHGDPSTQAIYFPVAGQPQAYIKDIYHDDVRTDGMGLGMLLAVELDKRDEFDRLWNYALAELQQTTGPNKGYFVSSCGTTINPTAPCFAPYGQQHMLMALLLANDRWGPSAATCSAQTAPAGSALPATGDASSDQVASVDAVGDLAAVADGGGGDQVASGAPDAGGDQVASADAGSIAAVDYAAGAKALLTVMRHKVDQNEGIVDGVTDIFDPKTALVFDHPDVTSADLTRPSIELPGFYDLWAQATGDPFWTRAASAARAYWKTVANRTTGLIPEGSHFDGTPVDGSDTFASEAYRAEVNFVVDAVWTPTDSWDMTETDSLLQFFIGQDINLYGRVYTLDGVVLDATRDNALVVANGITGLTATMVDKRNAFIQAVWDMDITTGTSRFFTGTLQLIGLMLLGGHFRVY